MPRTATALAILAAAATAAGCAGGQRGPEDGAADDGLDDGAHDETCTPETDDTFCSRRGARCGAITAVDNCGATRTVTSCGTCPAPQTCGAVGTPNLCGTLAWNDTYYVRTNGGFADQCDGTADAPYPGAGTGLHCAWNHPFIALPPGTPPRIAGGDRLIIGPGSYRMGVGAPGADACDADYAWDCAAPPIPSGPDAGHPTWIVGAGYDGDCDDPPQIWGTQRAAWVLSLAGTSHARVECLDITDRSGCVEFHSGAIACQRDTYPFGDWAPIGIVASDSTDVTLRNLDIHGLAAGGVHAGRLTDWTVENVRIAGNGWVGWDGDIEGDDGNSGTLVFRNWTVEWNGCGETYPGGLPAECWAQGAGGYGDGVGTGSTGGTWIIEASSFLHNTSDGLDLLYHDRDGSITIERVFAQGNAGNQIKTRGPTAIRNSVVVADCGFFQAKPFTFNVDPCRAFGNAVSLNPNAGDVIRLTNNTIYSEGDCLLEIGADACDGSETILSRNNILAGGVDFGQPDERSCFYYTECPGPGLDQDWGLIVGTKDDPCPVGPNDVCSDPLFSDAAPESFDGHLREGSPARDTGLGAGGDVPVVDVEGNARPRGSGVDRGAYEM